MDYFQKTVTKTGDAKIRIDKTKKILLIRGVESAALFNRQETYRLFHCDTVLQAWSLVYRHRPISSFLISPTRQRTDYPLCRNAGCWRARSDHRCRAGSTETVSRGGAAAPGDGRDSASSIAQSVGKVLRSLL